MENTKLNKEKKLNPPIGLIEKYQYLISKIAGQFNNISESKENLEEVGYIGLLNAANLYDKEVHQIDFQTFAQLLITEEMHQYLINKNRQVDRPDWLVNLNHRIDSYVIQYQEKYGRFPQISEISEYLNINTFGLQEILKARDSLLENYSLKQKEQKIDFTQIQPDLGKIKSQSYQSFKLPIEDLIALQRALKKLKKLSEGIIYYLFIMDLSQTRLAKIMSISPQQANQLKKEAYNQLK